MNQEVKDYLEGLRTERAKLVARISEIDSEMQSYGISTVPTKKCEECNGTGIYWDRWAGGIDCPYCGGTGIAKS